MTHDEENDRNEAWLRSLIDGLTASNSSAEELAQHLYAYAHGGRAAINGLTDWCETERGKIGALDGYDYRSGEEYGLRRAQLEIGRRLNGE